jgi:hypothetical protein
MKKALVYKKTVGASRMTSRLKIFKREDNIRVSYSSLAFIESSFQFTFDRIEANWPFSAK